MSLRGAGSTFSAALYNQWIENYHREHPSCPYTGRCSIPYYPVPPPATNGNR